MSEGSSSGFLVKGALIFVAVFALVGIGGVGVSVLFLGWSMDQLMNLSFSDSVGNEVTIQDVQTQMEDQRLEAEEAQFDAERAIERAELEGAGEEE